MKLTDIMFNLDFIAANCGAKVEKGPAIGEIFANETKSASTTGEIVLDAEPVPVVTGGTPYAWIKKSNETADRVKKEVTGNVISGLEAGAEYCIMYRKNVEGRKITISSQFIPETLHAVLTVALYSGDNCNVESATKAGEVVIDIPRLQLTGAQDITMSATGAAQTALEGNALASGCTGCDGQAIYATITEVISGAHWYDDADGLIIEDLSGFVAGQAMTKPLVVYAYYKDAAPKQVALSDLTVDFKENGTGLTYANGIITATTEVIAGTAVISAVCSNKASLDTNKAIVVA